MKSYQRKRKQPAIGRSVIVTGWLCMVMAASACEPKYHQIDIDGYAPGVNFSASGRQLWVNWYNYDGQGKETHNCAVYEVGTWKKLAELLDYGSCLAICSDEKMVLMQERSADGKTFDVVLRRLADGGESARYHMPLYWWPRVTSCGRESNLIWLDIEPNKIVAIDSSSGALVREYAAADLDEQYGGFTKYSPFEVQWQRDRLVWVDQYAAVLWVYRLSTGELLSRIDVWPDEYGDVLGQDYKMMDEDRLVFGLTGRKEHTGGAFLVVADLATLTREADFFIGNYYDLHGVEVMEPGDNRVLSFVHKYNASCGLVMMTDVKSGEQKIAIDLCSASEDSVFDAFTIPEEDVLLVPEWRNYYIYSYPDFKMVKKVEPDYSYRAVKYSPLRLSFEAVGSSSWVGIFDWRRLEYVDKFHVCGPINEYAKIDFRGHWGCAICEGIWQGPTYSAVALVDLRRYAKDAPECDDRSYLQCGADGNVHWYDSCGNDEGVALECDPAHSTGCENLSEHHAACRCAGNRDPHFGCRVCQGNLDPESDCTACQPHWSNTENNCLTCPDNWDRVRNCTVCRGNWDEAKDCRGCRGHWDPSTDCTACLPHWQDSFDDCGSCSSHWDISQDCNACLPGWYGDDCQYWYCPGQAEATGSFAEPVFFAEDAWTSAVAVDDFNGDGTADVAAAGSKGLTIYRGTGLFAYNQSKAFVQEYFYQDATCGYDISSGDFNGDGKVDLVEYCAGRGTVMIMIGTGSGFRPGREYPASTGYGVLQVADFNADGFSDVAVIGVDKDQVAILLGKGDGTLLETSYYGVGDGPLFLVVNDFNGDGILDLATANTTSDDISILMGNGEAGRGDGTFAPERRYYFQECVQGILTSGDFDGDGDIDLASGCNNDTDDELDIHLNDGSGNFSKLAGYAVPGTFNAITAADFNRDSIADILVTADRNKTVILYLGNESDGSGDGPFSQPKIFHSGGWPLDQVVADLNKDGLPDLVLAHAEPDALVMLLGSGMCR